MKIFKLKRIVVPVDQCFKSKTDSVRVKITLPLAGGRGFQNVALRTLCVFMCEGTGLFILKSP